jgi:hypothetical protein
VPAPKEIDLEIQKELAARGLGMDDLDALGADAALSKVRDAQRNKNAAEIKSALATLLGQIRSGKIERPLLEKKLDQVSPELNVVAKVAPQQTLERLQNRYFDLRERARKPLGASGSTKLAIEIEALRREIQAAGR